MRGHVGILGAGYVGLRAAEAFREAGYAVSLYSRQIKPGFLLWPGTIPSSLTTILFAVAPDSPESYKETYLHNSQILAKSAVKKILYTSSTSVYGEYHGKPVQEDSPLLPLNEKSQILIDTEKTLLNSDKEVLIYRLGEIIGPGRELGKRLKSRPILAGTGENIVNLSDVTDICRALIFALEHNLNGIYNLVSDFHPTRKELYDLIEPGLTWDKARSSPHGGNKLVSSEKLKQAGFEFIDVEVSRFA